MMDSRMFALTYLAVLKANVAAVTTFVTVARATLVVVEGIQLRQGLALRQARRAAGQGRH